MNETTTIDYVTFNSKHPKQWNAWETPELAKAALEHAASVQQNDIRPIMRLETHDRVAVRKTTVTQSEPMDLETFLRDVAP